MVHRLIIVVLVIDDLEYGGAQRQVVELANKIDQDRFDVHVCTLSHYVPLGGQLRERRRRLHTLVKRNNVDVTVVPRLARLLRSLNADIVHSYLFSADIASRLAGRLVGTKVVIGSERGANYVTNRRCLLAHRLTRTCIDLIIANSQTGAGFNSKTFGHPASDYRVIYNGVDTEQFQPRDKLLARKELGIPAESRVIGIVASFKAEKNHAMLFHAFKKVLQAFADAQLLIVGDQLYGNVNLCGNVNRSDDYCARMNTLIGELGIRHQCIFLGNRQDVERIYPACDITVLPSLHEGMPNVLLESMACGIPVVATNICDNSYVVKDGQTGFLVGVGDVEGMAKRIQTLLENDILRQTMGQKGTTWVRKEFSIEQLVRNTEAVYLEALDKNRSKRMPVIKCR